MRLLAVLALAASCGSPVAAVTAHGIEIASAAPAPDIAAVEQWTEGAALAWHASPCPQISARDVLADLQSARDAGLPVRLYWSFPPRSYGRFIYADREDRYLHELHHALIDGNGLAPWDNAAHHSLMCLCGLGCVQ